MRFPFRLEVALLTATLSAAPLLALGWLLLAVNAREVESSTQALRIALSDQVVARLDDAYAAHGRGLEAVARLLADDALAPSTARSAASPSPGPPSLAPPSPSAAASRGAPTPSRPPSASAPASPTRRGRCSATGPCRSPCVWPADDAGPRGGPKPRDPLGSEPP